MMAEHGLAYRICDLKQSMKDTTTPSYKRSLTVESDKIQH